MKEDNEGERRIEANGLNFRVVDRGSGPAVLLLHGWPDSSYLWRHQIPALVEAGFRVIAPDLRGFGESDRPEEVEGYGLMNILADLNGILQALKVDRLSVVGHDWGAGLAWLLATFSPERVERLVALAVGHPRSFGKTGIAEWQRRWYMLWYLFPGVAEEMLPKNDWAIFREMMKDGQGDTEKYIQDLSRPGALAASLNWYRANISPRQIGATGRELPPTQCPVLGVWGSQDFFLAETQMLNSVGHITGTWRYERLEGIGHWIPTGAPDRLNELLLEFLRP